MAASAKPLWTMPDLAELQNISSDVIYMRCRLLKSLRLLACSSSFTAIVMFTAL
jgi:hypothetical protein